MANKNTLLGGTDWTEEGLKPDDLNDTFDATINNYRNRIAFNHIDISSISQGNTTPTVKKTYTFAKAVDCVVVYTSIEINSSYSGFMTFSKNGGSKLTATTISALSGFSQTSGARLHVVDGTIEVVGLTTQYSGVGVLINVAFGIGDTLEIMLHTSNALGVVESDYRIVQGINNKTTDTTWVTVT
jgi:hypothetical protein